MVNKKAFSAGVIGLVLIFVFSFTAFAAVPNTQNSSKTAKRNQAYLKWKTSVKNTGAVKKGTTKKKLFKPTIKPIQRKKVNKTK
jgi:hypothetical protein